MNQKLLALILCFLVGHLGTAHGGDGEIEIEIGGQKIKIKAPEPGNGKEGGKGGTLGKYGPTKKIVYGPLDFLSRDTWWRVHHLDLLFGEDFFKRFDKKEGMGYEKAAGEPTQDELDRLHLLIEAYAWRGDFDGITRRLCMQALHAAPKKHLEAVITRFSESEAEKDIAFRRGFLLAAGELPNAKIRETVADLAGKTENTTELGLAIRALGLMKDASSHDLIHGKVKDDSLPLPVRALGILALRDMLKPESTGTLSKMAFDRSVEHQLRRACLLALGAAGKTTYDNLKHLVNDEPDNRIRATALRLMVLDNELTENELKILIRKLKGPDADLRGIAALALHQVAAKNPEIKKEILTRLNKEKDLRARKAMAFAAGALSEENKDLFTLKRLFKKDQHEDVIWFTAVGLGLSGFDKGAKLAVKSLDRINNPVAIEGICLCLGLMEGEDHVEQLTKMLADKGQPQVQATAALALGLRRQKEGLEPLDKALGAESSDVRAKAAVAEGMLDELARERAEKLARTSGSEKDRNARLMAALAAELLGTEGLFAETLDKVYKNRSEMPLVDCDFEELLREVNDLFPPMHRTTLGFKDPETKQ